MLPSNTWNMNIYNKKLVFIKKKQQLWEDNNMRVEKNNFVQFPRCFDKLFVEMGNC